MLFHHQHENKSFLAVAMSIIIIGAAIFAFGVVAWLINTFSDSICYVWPSFKILSGLVVLSLGYIILELELIRRK